MNLLEADRNIRNWRKFVIWMAKVGFMGTASVAWANDIAIAMLNHMHGGGTREGYIGPERQLDGWDDTDTMLSKVR